MNPLPPDEANPWKVVETSIDYENPYMVIEKNAVIRPDGNPGMYWVARFRRVAVGVVPLDDDGCTYLVGQYRFPTDRYEWELPEGGAEPDETPMECARRELAEEAGLEATELVEILHTQLSNSCTDEVSYTFLATGLKQVPMQPDATEKLRVLRLPLDEAVELALHGHIRDGISLASLLKVGLMKQRGLLKTPHG
jgi:8-oxo-dGTP pyrophosphatase MutT (NUDIX family)